MIFLYISFLNFKLNIEHFLKWIYSTTILSVRRYVCSALFVRVFVHLSVHGARSILRSIISLALRSLEVFLSSTPSLVQLIVRSLLRSRFCSFVCLIDRFQKLTFHLLCNLTRWSEKETRQRSLLSMNLTDQ